MKPLKLIIIVAFISLSFGCDDKFPSSEYQIGQISLGSAYNVAVNGNYAYVAYNSGVAVIDIGNPAKPKKLTTLKTSEAAFGILCVDNYLYIGAGGVKNLYVYDNANPQSSTAVSSIKLSGTVNGISKYEDYLFASTQNGYLEILNVSDLSNIIKVKTINCQGQGVDLIYNKSYIYYANSQKGLQVICVDNPSNPEIVITLPNTSGAWDVNINGDNLLLAKHMYGFNVFSLENPALPTSILTKNNGGESYALFTDETSLYVADLQQGIEIWDITDIQNPVLSETIGKYAPHDLTARDNLIFLADQDRGFVVLRY